MTNVVDKWKRTGLLKGLEEKEWGAFSENCEMLAGDILKMDGSKHAKSITNLTFPIQRRVHPIKVNLDYNNLYANGKKVCSLQSIAETFENMTGGLEHFRANSEVELVKMLADRIRETV